MTKIRQYNNHTIEVSATEESGKWSGFYLIKENGITEVAATHTETQMMRGIDHGRFDTEDVALEQAFHAATVYINASGK